MPGVPHVNAVVSQKKPSILRVQNNDKVQGKLDFAAKKEQKTKCRRMFSVKSSYGANSFVGSPLRKKWRSHKTALASDENVTSWS